MPFKALFFSFDKMPFKDIEQLIKLTKAESNKIIGKKKIKILNILSCSYPKGYVVVVEVPGRVGGRVEKQSENSKAN